MSGLYLTANNIKVKAGSIADWYISFGRRVKSISKKLDDDEDPWDDSDDDVYEDCERDIDQCYFCMGCGNEWDCYCPSASEMDLLYGRGNW